MSESIINELTADGTQKLCACGMPFPVAQGKYPSTCPSCQQPYPVVEAEDEPVSPEADQE